MSLQLHPTNRDTNLSCGMEVTCGAAEVAVGTGHTAVDGGNGRNEWSSEEASEDVEHHSSCGETGYVV